MFCTICTAHYGKTARKKKFITGTRIMKKRDLDRHHTKLEHATAVAAQRQRATLSIPAAMKNATNAEAASVIPLLRNAYYVAKTDSPLSSYEDLCNLGSLQVRDGASQSLCRL